MAWNINRGTSRDLPRVRDEQVDVAVLSEASARLAAVACLDAYDDFLRERPCLIAGDFNLAPGLMDLPMRNVEVGTHAGWVARKGDQSGNSDHVPLIVDIG